MLVPFAGPQNNVLIPLPLPIGWQVSLSLTWGRQEQQRENCQAQLEDLHDSAGMEQCGKAGFSLTSKTKSQRFPGQDRAFDIYRILGTLWHQERLKGILPKSKAVATVCQSEQFAQRQHPSYRPQTFKLPLSSLSISSFLQNKNCLPFLGQCGGFVNF